MLIQQAECLSGSLPSPTRKLLLTFHLRSEALNELSLITLQGGKDVLIDLSGIAEHDKTYVAHVFLRSALDVGRRDRA